MQKLESVCEAHGRRMPIICTPEELMGGGSAVWEDPIVAEVQRTRQELGAKFGIDVQAIVADIRQRQPALGSRLVSLAAPAEPVAAPDRGGVNGSSTAVSEQPPQQVS